ncbi:hypothetical protein ABIC76_000650 [Ralstonia sp. 1138]
MGICRTGGVRGAAGAALSPCSANPAPATPEKRCAEVAEGTSQTFSLLKTS